MGALQRIFGRDEKFYDLLEASAAEANNSATLLRSVLEKIGQQKATEETLADLAQSRRKHKRITQEITEKLCKSFVTPLEREDIETLSTALHKISKNLEKIGERLTFCSLGPSAENVSKQVFLLERATEAVVVMVKALRRKAHVEKIRDTYERLQSVEGEADRLITAGTRGLYEGEADAKEAVFLKDIYELLEKVIDRCRDAGNSVFQIVLKYS